MEPEPHIDAASNLIRGHEGAPAPDYDAPLVTFVSNMTLTRRGEDKLTEYCDRWEKSLKDSSGWNETGDTEEFIFQGVPGADPFMLGSPYRTHFAKRAFYKAVSENDWRWRQWMFGKDSVFAKQNLSVPLARSISRKMAAKGIAAFFKVRPYFTCIPVGP